MKRLAISLAFGCVAALITGCDKGEGNKARVPGEELTDAESRGGENREIHKEDSAAVITRADAMRYIPDGANLLLGMDSAKVVGSALMMDNMDLVREGDVGEALAAADACHVGVSTWKYAVVGGNTEKDREVVVFFSATGVGERRTLDCIGQRITEADPQERFEVGEENGRVVVLGGNDGEKIYAVSDDVIAIVGRDSQVAFNELLNGNGRPALEGSLKGTLASVDQSKHIYFGMVATDDMRIGATEGLESVTGSVDLSAGLSVVLSGEFSESAKASELSDIANKQFNELKGMAGAFGIPDGIVESVRIEPKGAAIDISVSATGDELKELSEHVRAQLSRPSPTPHDQRPN